MQHSRGAGLAACGFCCASTILQQRHHQRHQHQHQSQHSGSRAVRAAMAQWGLSLVAVAVLVHLLVITSVAHQGLPSREARSYDAGVHRGGGGGKHHEADSAAAGAAAASGANALRSAPAPTSIFATENSTVAVAQVGGTATLPCVVRKFASGVVSWIRRKDYQLLTVGLATYSSDSRFQIVHARHLQSWALQIKFVQPQDAGWYECQVSTHPPTSIFVELKVTEAVAEIAGAPDLHLRSGSELRLICKLRRSTEAPEFVFWYHDDRMINFDEDRGVAVSKGRGGSQLLIPRAERTDSGNYTCAPSNARAASITVHVIEGEKPAAMQHDSRSAGPPPAAAPGLVVALLALLCLWSSLVLAPACAVQPASS
ncbi:lachesin-like isoform X2 [Schistocerca gregaria]|uniref:lachesin-like isoform X2 n=1 Tax=Schistocerca gregaria TaxID=7010 RepID=UPI00211F1A87|nr:lachesin-like isoform X2 [Schistocerca gregaria]